MPTTGKRGKGLHVKDQHRARQAGLITAPGVKRRHFGVKLRTDFRQPIRDVTDRLHCSQSVWIELLIQNELSSPRITDKDVFAYDSDLRWAQEVIGDLEERDPKFFRRGKRDIGAHPLFAKLRGDK